jgi:hypothetical protein
VLKSAHSYGTLKGTCAKYSTFPASLTTDLFKRSSLEKEREIKHGIDCAIKSGFGGEIKDLFQNSPFNS